MPSKLGGCVIIDRPVREGIDDRPRCAVRLQHKIFTSPGCDVDRSRPKRAAQDGGRRGGYTDVGAVRSDLDA